MKLYTVDNKQYLKLRSIATLIDYGIFFILYYFYLAAFGTESNGTSYTITGLPTLVIPLYWFIYFVVLEAINQATPGHEIMKLRVFKSEGYKITLTDAFIRRILDPIDFVIPAFICISKTPKHQRLGDLLANTVVLKASDVTEKEVTFKQ